MCTVLGPSLELVRKLVQCIANNNPDGVTFDELNRQYIQQEGEFIPYGTFGYLSLEDFLVAELSDVVSVEGIKSIVLVYPIESERSKHILELARNPKKNQKCPGQRSERMQATNGYSSVEMQRQLIEDQIEMRESLLRQYMKLQSLPQVAAAQNFNETSAQTNNNHRLDENVQVSEKLRNGGPKISPLLLAKIRNNESIYGRNKTAETFDVVDGYKMEKKYLSNQTLDDYVSDISATSSASMDCLSEWLDMSAKPKDLIETFSVGSVFDVVVSELNCPFTFWIQLNANKMDLENLVKAMSKYYTVHGDSDSLKVPWKQITVGEIYAILFKDCWYRVEVRDVPEKGIVKVSFIDYGMTECVGVLNLRRLTDEYRNKPVYAVCCKLGNVKPKKLDWSDESAHKFVQLVEDKSLYARILHIEANKATVELIVKSTKLCVNDELIKLGLAKRLYVERTFPAIFF